MSSPLPEGHEQCECGELVPAADVTVDLSGCTLCPECAKASRIPCELCGDDRAVKLFPLDGSQIEDHEEFAREHVLPFMYDDDYIAICQSCDNPEGVMK